MDSPALETATWPRRMLALLVDWIACTLVVVAVIGPTAWLDDRLAGTYTMGVFLLESALFTALLGGSFGKLATRLRVVRLDGSGPAARPRAVPAAGGPRVPGDPAPGLPPRRARTARRRGRLRHRGARTARQGG